MLDSSGKTGTVRTVDVRGKIKTVIHKHTSRKELNAFLTEWFRMPVEDRACILIDPKLNTAEIDDVGDIPIYWTSDFTSFSAACRELRFYFKSGGIYNA